MNQIPSQRFGLYQVIFGWMNFVLVVPGIYLLLGLPLTMREYGWSGTDIGFFQLAGLPAVFKLLLALPVQRFRLGTRHYSYWVSLLVLALAGLLYLISDPGMLARRMPLFLLALAISLLSTWADIPLNALTIKLLPRSEQMRAGSIRAMALFLGAIVGSGFMLVLQGLWGWQAPFYIMLVSLLIGLLLMRMLQEESQNSKSALQPSKQPIMDLSGYFRQPAAKLWTCLLMTSFPFIGAAWLYLKPMLLDLGVAAQHVAWIVGVGGGMVGAVSSLLSGRLVQYLGVAKAIPCYLFCALLTLIALTLSVSLKLDQTWVIISILLVAISMGAISSLMFGLMMFFTRHQRRASDYGLQASLFVITRLTFPLGAGLLLDTGGYSLMLSGLTCGVLAVFVFALLAGRHIHRMVEYLSQLSQEED
ncbi:MULTISPECIES: MFS transporter [unclassified Brenneria]|uniref:MFS transporter n=1 Tax=unclassified Brenneria TaxID=2634434 RepID=UPI0029C4502E|nr:MULTISPECIES: MFS transporter [unclassified Brenneria]MDX5627204.1 MFS transporter [Brenneria sp. L3-3Z]MDX5694641.1 MFS transporter [Brenneria sp. L4-2C]